MSAILFFFTRRSGASYAGVLRAARGVVGTEVEREREREREEGGDGPNNSVFLRFRAQNCRRGGSGPHVLFPPPPPSKCAPTGHDGTVNIPARRRCCARLRGALFLTRMIGYRGINETMTRLAWHARPRGWGWLPRYECPISGTLPQSVVDKATWLQNCSVVILGRSPITAVRPSRISVSA